MTIRQQLQETAAALVARGKGILAIDESTPTIKKRFDAIDVESTEQNRRSYRDLLITNHGDAEYISGMILYDETIRQAAADGTPFPRVLMNKNIMPGIKVDKGAKELALHPDEKVTEGLDGLADRLAEYNALGAKFAKWRAVITIGDKLPSPACIDANAHALARYAGLCQAAGLVPIVEPEVLMDADHTIECCYEVTAKTLSTLFNTLRGQGVSIEHTLLKTNMVIAGKQCSKQAGVDEVAAQTVRCLRQNVPAELPGIVFLSGGQTAVLATAHLNAMNAAHSDLPWPLSFSYGRALQEPCLKVWGGDAANIAAAQKALLHRERCNSLACLGKYTEDVEQAA